MRLPSYIHVVSVAMGTFVRPEVDDNEACAFVGSRFAHVGSECISGNCNAVRLTKEGFFEESQGDGNVGCEQARDVMIGHFREMFAKVPHDVSDEDRDLTLAGALEALQSVVSGADIDLARLEDSLHKMNILMWSLPLTNWHHWRGDINELFPHASWVNEHFLILNQILVQGMIEPFWTPTRRDAIGACMFYLFDLRALTGALYRTPLGNLAFPNTLLKNARPLYRLIHAMESPERQPAVPWNIALGHLMDGGSSPGTFEKASRDLIQTYDHATGPLEKLAFASVGSGELCRDPERWIQSYPRQEDDHRAEYYKWGIHVIAFCARKAEASLITAAQTVIAKEDFGEGFGMIGEMVEEGDAVEKSRVLVWLATLVKDQGVFTVTADGRSMRLKTPSELGILYPAGFDGMGAVFSEVARAVGRAIQTGCSVASLNLAQSLVPLLHPRIRAQRK